MNFLLDAGALGRILVVQALVEPTRLVTHDQVIARYSETIIEN